MGLKHIDRVKEIPPGLVTTAERHVLTMLAADTNDKRDGWAHGYDAIESATGMGPRTVRRHLASLEAAGFIKRMRQKHLGNGSMGRVTIVLTIEAGIRGEGTKAFRRTPDIGRLHEWEQKHATN